jgi:hypothetical protein
MSASLNPQAGSFMPPPSTPESDPSPPRGSFTLGPRNPVFISQAEMQEAYGSSMELGSPVHLYGPHSVEDVAQTEYLHEGQSGTFFHGPNQTARGCRQLQYQQPRSPTVDTYKLLENLTGPPKTTMCCREDFIENGARFLCEDIASRYMVSAECAQNNGAWPDFKKAGKIIFEIATRKRFVPRVLSGRLTDMEQLGRELAEHTASLLRTLQWNSLIAYSCR